MEYNEEQQAAISCPKDVVIVVAGPGSGKSHTLVGRIVQSVRSGVSPQSICVMTFTNNGARVFADRLERFGVEGLHYMGTLHGYCMRLIQNYGALLGYRPGTVSIVTEDARALLVDQIRKELKQNITDKVLNEEPQSVGAALIWGELRFRLKRANMVDYDGILRDGLALLKNDKVKLMVALEELLVDERQDSGAIDTEIFRAIPAKRRFYCGDPDQCIFGFRKARPDLFVQEAAEHGFIALEHNFRSDKVICEAANKLISYNDDRVPKTIKPESSEEGLVTVTDYKNEGEEIYGTWSKIRLAADHIPLSQMAVLARTNLIAAKYRDAMRGLGLNVAGKERLSMPPTWRVALSLISLMVDPANDLHAEAILRARATDDEIIADYKVKAADQGLSLSTVAGLPRSRPDSIKDASLYLARYIDSEAMAVIMERVKVLPDNATLSDLLVDLSNPGAWETKLEAERPESGLTVATVHGAKGSEWDVVFVVGMEEGVFPSKQAIDAGDIEEERRLAFVAVTRSKHRLYLTWAKKRTAFFKTTDQQPSRFLSEMNA